MVMKEFVGHGALAVFVEEETREADHLIGRILGKTFGELAANDAHIGGSGAGREGSEASVDFCGQGRYIYGKCIRH